MACSICEHVNRASIENAILNISSGNSEITLEKIAEEYHIEVNDIKVHAMMHTPLGVHLDESNEVQDSLARRIKIKEADILEEITNEYMVTLKAVGKKIHTIEDIRLLPNAVCNLYLGLGGEIRGTVKSLTELDAALNGPKDSGTSGLIALANALRGSQPE